MRLGLALSLATPVGAGATVVNPATLSLTGYWRNYNVQGTWTGTASAGASNGRVMSWPTGAEQPIVGSDADGNFATFDGTNDLLREPTLTGASYFTASAYRIVMLVKPRNASAANANAYLDEQLMAHGSDIGPGISWTTSGVRAWHYGGGADWTPTASVACSAAAWHVVDVLYDGTNLSIAVDGTVGTPLTKANVGSAMSDTVRFGRNHSGVAFAEMDLAEVWFSNTTLASVSRASAHLTMKTAYPNRGLP
jgi:hypothetical protein